MEAALLTMAQAEAEHDALIDEMQKIGDRIKSGLGCEDLAEAFCILKDIRKRAEALSETLKIQKDMAHYLISADPYGGPQ